MRVDPIVHRTSRCPAARKAGADDATHAFREQMHVDSGPARAQEIAPGEYARAHSEGRLRFRDR